MWWIGNAWEKFATVIIFSTENQVYAEKRIRDTYAHLLINVKITIEKK